MRIASLLTALILTGCAGNAPTGKQILVPEMAAASYADWHYAPAVVVGDLVILSGVPAWSQDGDYERAVRNMFTLVKATLEAAGATMDDVIEINTHHARPRDSAAFGEELTQFLKVHKEYFLDAYPAWTATGNAVLLQAGAPVEMRVVAIRGSGRHKQVRSSLRK